MKTAMLIKYGDAIDYINRLISGPCARFLARFGLDPHYVTVLRSVMVVYAMYLFLRASVWSFFWAGVLVQAADILDYVDGDLARLLGKTSKLGEWMEYFENNFQGTVGSLLGFSIAYGLYVHLGSVAVWIVLFFACFGMHMKKALIITPIRHNSWIFNLMDKTSFESFNSEMNKSLILTAGKMILFISTRELNLVFAVCILLPAVHPAWGFTPVYCAMVGLAAAHNLTWIGLAYYQLMSLLRHHENP